MTFGDNTIICMTFGDNTGHRHQHSPLCSKIMDSDKAFDNETDQEGNQRGPTCHHRPLTSAQAQMEAQVTYINIAPNFSRNIDSDLALGGNLNMASGGNTDHTTTWTSAWLSVVTWANDIDMAPSCYRQSQDPRFSTGPRAAVAKAFRGRKATEVF